MPLPASANAISFSQVNTELGLSSTAQISLNDAAVRSLFGKTTAGSAISMSDGHGKSASFAASITTNQQEMNLRTFAVSAGWNESSAANITLNSNIYVWSDNTANPAMTINGSWPGGVTLTNNGFIMGRGGNGDSSTFPNGQSASAGGVAISLGVNCSIVNNSGAFIGGGGGGGRGMPVNVTIGGWGGGGGGAGGGRGGGHSTSNPAGGAVGQAGANGGSGSGIPSRGGWGGGGGRIFPGTGGAGGGIGFPQPGDNDWGFPGRGGGAGGGGGGRDYGKYGFIRGRPGGSGGSVGGSVTYPGFPGVTYIVYWGGSGGGGWGASSGSHTLPARPFKGAPRAAMAGGHAIALNGFTATRTGSGTTFGAVS